MQTKKRKRKFCILYFIHSLVQPEDNKNSVIFTIAKSWLYQRRGDVVFYSEDDLYIFWLNFVCL